MAAGKTQTSKNYLFFEYPEMWIRYEIETTKKF